MGGTFNSPRENEPDFGKEGDGSWQVRPVPLGKEKRPGCLGLERHWAQNVQASPLLVQKTWKHGVSSSRLTSSEPRCPHLRAALAVGGLGLGSLQEKQQE